MTDPYRQDMMNAVWKALEEYGKRRNPPVVLRFTTEISDEKTSSECFLTWAERGRQALSDGQWEPLEYLFALFQADDLERMCVAVCLAAELEPDCGPVIRSLQREGALPTAGFLMKLYGPGADAGHFSSHGVLRRWFLEPGRAGGRETQLEQPLKLRERVVEFALGKWENRKLSAWTSLLFPEKCSLTSLGRSEYESWHLGFQKAHAGKLPGQWVFLIGGPEGMGKKTQLVRLAQESGRPVFCADRRRLDPSALRGSWMELIWECKVNQAFLAVEHWNPSDGREEEWGSFLEQASWEGEALIILSEEAEQVQFFGRHVWKIELSLPDLAEAAELWRFLASGYSWREPLRAEELAGLFLLSPGQVEEMLAGAWGRAGDGGTGTEEVKAFCRENLSGQSGGSLRRVPLKFGWEDLVLPGPVVRMLKDACAQAKNKYAVYETWGLSEKIAYGTGTSLVFSGSPGTGKTMAAQVLARELGLELFRIDLAAVVSKYIGETEKNLNVIFEEGRKSQAVLFFDEADVLFSKRTEVRDSNDKYSNMEAAFLLQKMEEYTGTVILATNYLQNVDEAFKRRMTFLIEFPFPDPENRRRLWEISIPQRMRLENDVDFDFLSAHFELSGSQIKNSVRNGAFLAVGDGENAVGMRHLLLAVKRELEKSGKKLSAGDFGEYGGF